MAPVPALPDSERRSRHTVSATTGPLSCGFAVYGSSTDYEAWLEVWHDGVPLTPVTDWTLDSPSGSISTLARPITDARITFTVARTGTIDIVGADRPRRATQLTESQGVPARAFNQFATQMVARLRETWDTSRRSIRAIPGHTLDPVDFESLAGQSLAVDSDGQLIGVPPPSGSGGTLTNNAVIDAYLRDSGPCSVIGRSANSSGDPADISASANGQIFVRLSDALAFANISTVLDSVFGSTQGMVLRRGASAWEAVAVGSAGQVPTSNGTTWAWAAPTAGLPRGYIDGCGMANNASDATNDIDITAGTAQDSTHVVDLVGTAMTKRLDADFTAGTGNGMRYSGAAIANGTYHIFLIGKADGTTDYFAYSGVDPTAVLPTGYLYFRRIGSILRSAGAIVGFIQKGDRFWRKVGATDVAISATNPGTSALTATLSVPTGIEVVADITFEVRATSADSIYGLVTALDQTDSSPGTAGYTVRAGVSGPLPASATARAFVKTNTSGQIRYRMNVSSTNDAMGINTSGWIDTRGRDA